jgi:flagellar FliL protein
MSDEQQDLNLEDVGAGADDVAGPRRGGLLSGMLLNILKWAAIGVGAVIIVVTTTVITFRVLNKGNTQQGMEALSPAYQAKAVALSAYDGIEQIRGLTSDEVPAVYLLKVRLGYDAKDKEISVEMGERAAEILDLLLKLVSRKTAAELAPVNYGTLQEEMKNEINMIMTKGKIKSVMFKEFTVVR